MRLYLGAVSLSQVVRQVVLDLGDELLGVVGVEAEHLAEPFEADVLQVAVGEGLHAGVGLNHLLLGEAVGADQVTPTLEGETQVLEGGREKKKLSEKIFSFFPVRLCLVTWLQTLGVLWFLKHAWHGRIGIKNTTMIQINIELLIPSKVFLRLPP